MKKHLILASRSPRRAELLRSASYDFRIVPPPDSSEPDRLPEETFHDYVLRLAVLKAGQVADRLLRDENSDHLLILACDSLAICSGELLGKPKDREDARRMLTLLSGSEHEVLTGLCLRMVGGKSNFPIIDGCQNIPGGIATVETSRLIMDPLSERQINDYLDSRQWCGKAGAFGYQDQNDWLHLLQGSETNVVGLPMERLNSIFTQLENHEKEQ